MEQKNEVQKMQKGAYMTKLAQMQQTFTDMVVNNGQMLNLQYDDYQKLCIMNLVGRMQELLTKENKTFNEMDKSNITNILQTAAMLNLNISAVPSECYLIMRAGQFEFNIEGDGNDKLLRKFGVDVEKVYTPWKVRENDEFSYPSFNGLEIEPPVWKPRDYYSKIVRVVYPIKKTDGTVEYHISERESVVHNLQAHISNNILKRKDMTAEEKERINAMASDMALDEILSSKELLPYISPAWKSAGSREAMIERKMRNNATKKYPKDFRNALVASAYEHTYEDYEQYEDERIDKEAALETEVIEKSMIDPVQAEDTAVVHDQPREDERIQEASFDEVPAPKRGPSF